MAGEVAACWNSNLNVAQWCKENEVCVQIYYRWQKKLFSMGRTQREPRFAEVTPFRAVGNIEVIVRIAGAETGIYRGEEMQLPLRLCSG